MKITFSTPTSATVRTPALLSTLLLVLLSSSTALANRHPTPEAYAQQQPMQNWQADKPTGPPLLGDVIPLDRSISIFSDLTRSVETVQTRISSTQDNTTVLAPGNAAISRLPRKPWEGPEDEGRSEELYSGMGGEDRAGRNLRRFVEMHCVGVSPWEKGVKVETLGGGEVWWDEEDGVKKIYPDGIPVKRVQGEVENGALWIIDGVINYTDKERK